MLARDWMLFKLSIICFVIVVSVPSAAAASIAVVVTLCTARDLVFHTGEVEHEVCLLAKSMQGLSTGQVMGLEVV